MLKRIIAAGFVLALFVVIGTARPAMAAVAGVSVTGTVTDAQTGDPLPGANIILVGTSMGASTNTAGKYSIANVPPGSYTVRATYIGYKTVERALTVREGTAVVQDFKLDAVSLEGETIVVTAQAQGQNQAINEQLSSNQITNVVSSARIQELPDPNAAESVGRLPGVSVVRSGGEGTQVVIRGLQPKYNAVTVDGVRMASSNPNDRSVDLSMISPYMLEGIEVSKTVTADRDADVLGGSVNFRMKEAGGTTEGKVGLGLSLLAQMGYNGLSNAPSKYNNYKYVASVDGRFFDSKFGVFVQADLERRNLTSNELGASYTHRGNSYVDYTTSSLNLYDIPRDRQRSNGTLVLDYVLPEGKIKLTNFLSSGATDVQNRQELYDITNNSHNYSFAYSHNTLNLLTNALTLEHKLSIFNANLRLSHTYSENKSPGDWTIGFQQSSAGVGVFNNQPGVNPQDIPPAAIDNLSNAALTSMLLNNSFSRERALTAALDLETPVGLSEDISATIKFGGKYRYQTRSYIYDAYTGQGMGLNSANFIRSQIALHFPSTAGYAGVMNLPMAPFVDPGFAYGKFLGGNYPMTHPLSYAMLTETQRFVRSNVDLFLSKNEPGFFHDRFASTTNNYDGHENLSAAYVMATVNIGPQITFIPGVRYQNLKTTYTAARGLQNTSSALGGPYLHRDTTLTAEHGYWLPDLALRYKPLDWFDIRLSYSNTLAYPDYNAIIPRIDWSVGNSIAWNNYQLIPSRSHNYDVYLSFYENSIGLLTAGAFLKRIDNLIYSWSFFVSGAEALKYFPPNIGAPQAGSGTYSVTTFVNNPYRIDDYGVELDWQTHFWYLPKPLDGLVLNVNYTHIFSKAQYPYTDARKSGRTIYYVDTSFTDRLLYQPDDIVNLSIGYDYDKFSLRVSMLYQTGIFTGVNFWPQLRSSTSAYTRWDIAVKQELPWFGLQLFADVYNVNGANDVSVIQAATRVPQSEQSYGLTADVGLRWQY